jgi:hypothetical protein
MSARTLLELEVTIQTHPSLNVTRQDAMGGRGALEHESTRGVTAPPLTLNNAAVT